MGVFDNLLKRWGYIKAPARYQYPEFARADADVERWNIPDPSIYGNQADLYRTLSWISIAVSMSANSAAVYGFNVKRREAESMKDIPNHEFERFLENPNPLQSQVEFFEDTFSYLSLTGNCYWWINRLNDKAKPIEIWVIAPSQIRPIPDENMFLRGYLYDPGNGKEIPLEPYEICHFKRFNPNSMFVGLSPIEAVATQAQADKARVKWDARLYDEENGRLPGILAFADMIPESDWIRLQKESRDKANKREMMMLRGTGSGGVNWIQTNMSNSDMQFLEQRTFTKEEIFALFAPGLSSMLAINATQANSLAGKATFAEYTLWPAMNRVAKKVTKEILPTYAENLVGEFDDPRVKDRTLELQEIAEYSKTHTLEEIRKRYYEDDPLGDERDQLLPVQINAQSGGVQESAQPPQLQQMPEQQPEMEDQQEDMPDEEEPQDEEQPQEDEQPVDAAESEELAKWHRFAQRRFKEGKGAAQPFTTWHISQTLHDAIMERLSTVSTANDITSAFRSISTNAKLHQPVVDNADELKCTNDLLERSNRLLEQYGALLNGQPNQ